MTGLVPSKSIKESLAARALEYEKQLTPEAAQYLTSRGITKETAQYFRIGFVNDPIEGDDYYRKLLSIPYITPTGIVAMKFRPIEDTDGARFLTYSGTVMRRLYNVLTLQHPHLTIYLTEGESDTWTAHQCGLPVVGVPGVSNWSKNFSRIFRNRRVVILADGDDSGQGQEFAERVIGDVEYGSMVLFEGSDVNSYYREHGREALRKKVGVDVG